MSAIMASDHPFGARQRAGKLAVPRACDAQRPRERLENRLHPVVAGSSVQDLHVHVGAGAKGEPLEEILDQLGLEIAHAANAELEIDDGVRASSQVDRRDCQRLVHRHDEVAGPVDAPAVAHRLRDGFTQRDAEILDGVVLIDVEVAGARANVHAKVLYGRSSHHHVEAVFKAFARALRVACARDERLAAMLPSTKGLL